MVPARGQSAVHAQERARRPILGLRISLFGDRGGVRRPPHPAAEHALRHVADARADGRSRSFRSFVLPDVLLPWLGRNGWFEPGHPLRGIADHLFESYDGPRGHERAYWRAIGFLLAWPLLVYNVFMEQPNAWWLGISFVQTFVLIPLIVWRWGKGAYCGWLCSCGALAETLGDAHRRKMPHGPGWNRLNMLGQAVLAFAFALLGLRIAGWVMGPQSWPSLWFRQGFETLAVPQLPMGGGPVPERRAGHRTVLLVQRADVVPVRVSAGGVDAHLRAVFAVPHLPGQEEVHLVQRLHERLPSGHRRDELRQQGRADGGPAMRALLGVRAGVPDGRAFVRALRRGRAARKSCSTACPPRPC